MSTYKTSDLFNKIKQEVNEERASSSAPALPLPKEDDGGKYQTSERYNRIKESTKTGNTYGVDASYINSFLNDSQSFFEKQNKRLSSLNWQTATDKAAQQSRADSIADLKSRSATVRSYLNSQAGEDVSAYLSYLDNINKSLNEIDYQFRKAEGVYGKYGTEEDFKASSDGMLLLDRDTAQKEIGDIDSQIAALQAENSRINQASYLKGGISEEEKKRSGELVGQINALKKEKDKKQTYLKDSDAMKAAVEQYRKLEDQNKKWESEYSALSYSQLQDKLFIMPDSEERQWLESYADSRREVSDYDSRISEIEALLREYDRIVLGAVPEANKGDASREFVSRYGQPEALENELEQLKADRWRKEKSDKFLGIENSPDVQVALSTGDDYRYEAYFSNALSSMRDDIMWLTDKEAAVWHTLKQKGDGDEKEYLEYLAPTLGQRKAQQWSQDLEQLSGTMPITANLLTVPMKLVSGVGYLKSAGSGLLDDIVEGVTGEYQGPQNLYTNETALGMAANRLIGSTSEKISDFSGRINLDPDKHPVFSRILNGKGLGDLYQIGMSRLDSLAVAALSPVLGVTGASALLGGSAASQGMLDALSKGATDDQAIKMGFWNGLNEMLFEMISLDQLVSGNTSSIIKSMLIQGGVEASEETMTTIANNAADFLIMAEKSGYSQKVKEYQNQGLSLSEAISKAQYDIWGDTAWDAISGFLSGVAGGGAVNASQNGILKTAADVELYNNFKQQFEQMEQPSVNVPESAPTAVPVAGETGVDGNVYGSQNTAAQRSQEPVVTDEIADEYRAFYNAGFRGSDVESVAWKGKNLTAEQKAKAWMAGSAAAKASIIKGKKTAFVNYGQNGQVVESPEALDLKKKSAGTYKQLQSLAQNWGVNILVGDYDDTINGSIKDGVIMLNAKKFRGKNRYQIVSRIFAHEVTHRMQETAAEAYAVYRNAALEAVAQQGNGHLEAEIRRYQEAYEKAERKRLGNKFDPKKYEAITDEEAMDEIAADYTQAFLEDTQMFRDFAEANRTSAKNLIDFAKEIIAKVNKTFGDRKQQNAAAVQETGYDLDTIENALKLWEKAYAEGQKAVKNAPVRETVSEESPKYSIKKKEYWKPKLTQSEWDLLKYRLEQEIKTSDNYLDPETKWLYANKKGIEVVAIYGIGNGTEVTILYAAGGKRTKSAYSRIQEYLGGYDNESTANWATADRLLEALQSKQSRRHDGVSRTGNRGTATGNVQVSKQEQGSNSRTDSYTSSENSGKRVKYSLSGTENLLFESREDAYDEAVRKYGKIEPGEKPTRTVEVPKKSAPDQKVSYTIRTALEAGVTPDILVPKIQEEIISGQFSDEVHTNKRTLEKAEAWLKAYPEAEKALNDWNKKINSGISLDETDTVKGYLLYNLLATRASNAETTKEMERYSKEAIEVLTSVANLTRASARMVQATRLLKRLTPAGQYFSLEKAVERLNQQIANDTAEIQLKKGITKLEIDQEIAAQWMQALHDGNIPKVEMYEDQLYDKIANQVAITFKDRWNAWRYLSMLGNVKTLTRNYIGNLFMTPAKFTKDKLAAVMEQVLPQEQRTKYLGNTHTAAGNAVREFAKQDFSKTEKLVSSDPKYSDYSSQKLMQHIREQKSKLEMHGVKEWQQIVDWAMNGRMIGDSHFIQKHYANSFTQIALARGWTVEQIKSGRIKQEVLDTARSKAYLEAQKATFRDINLFSSAVRKIRFKETGKNKGWAIAGNIFIEGVLPFKVTPANVLVRAVEYSPVELVWNLTVGTYSVAKGNIDASEYIDRMASGLTGTGVFALGMLLKNLGFITGGAPDDDEERMGYQAYSLNIGGKSFSLDWLSPMSIPFFLGVELQNAMDSEYADFSSYISAVLNSFQPLLEMSCLSGVQALIDVRSYLDGAQVEQIACNIMLEPLVNYVSQGIPTFLSQTANTFEKQGEKTYTADMQTTFSRNVHYPIIKAFEKIPLADWRQVPRIDAWGRVEEKKTAGDYAISAFESYISPSYINTIQITDADREIERLQGVFQTQLNDVNKKLAKATSFQEKAELRKQATELQSLMNISPDLASTKISNIRLTQQEYITYAETKGKQNYELFNALIKSSWYKSLNDKEKSAAIQEVYDWADAKGRYAAVGIIKQNFSEEKIKADTATAILLIQEKMERNWTDAAITAGNSDLKNAILAGTSAGTVKSELLKNGKTEEDIQEYSRTEIRKMFNNGDLSDTAAVDRLKKYGGLDSSGAVDRVTYWKWMKVNPNAAFADGQHETAALKYERTLKPRNISLDTWEDVYESRFVSKEKKEEVWAVIHTLPISKSQKDALYYACNYAESGLKNTPWHK